MPSFAEVLLDDALDRPLDYAIPSDLILQPGSRVKVPLRKAVRWGTVLLIKDSSSYPAQPILECLFSISKELFDLAEWMAQYYCAPLRKTLQAILPASIREEKRHKEQWFIKSLLSPSTLATTCEQLRRTHPAQAGVLDILLHETKGLLLSQLLEKTASSKSPINTLIKKKILSSTKVQIDRSILDEYEYFPIAPKTLNQEQQEALNSLLSSLESRQFATHLLHGVTGSGKTEIYLQAMEATLAQNRTVLFLVPEIALTSQTVERLRGRFQEKITLLHHRLSDGEKHDTWHQIQNGFSPIVVGARSAIFSPLPRLGLIIIDEEHESAYKQSEESPSYHARDVAIMRGKLNNATVLLGSATPSLESYHNAQAGKYQLNVLKTRADSASLPQVEIVDMQRNKGATLFSDPLLKAIEQRLSVGEQTMLFLNRRGYRTAQLCSKCAHVIACPHCDMKLTFHLSDNQLACHLCNYQTTPPRTCPKCHATQGFEFKGAGTEMVERSLHALFPDIRTLRLDADTTRHKGAHERLFKQFRSGKADLLIGTQMIAKGLHFPSVTLVGILNADAHLQVPDFRASEHVFQLITQVAGRAGRGALPGQVIIQTRMPDHPVIHLAAAQDYPTFFTEEKALRELFRYPPFSRLIKLVFSSKNQEECLLLAKTWRNALIPAAPSDCELMPIIPCGHPKIDGHHRFQFIIRSTQRGPLLKAIDTLRTSLTSKEVRLLIDIDPLSTFY